MRQHYIHNTHACAFTVLSPALSAHARSRACAMRRNVDHLCVASHIACWSHALCSRFAHALVLNVPQPWCVAHAFVFLLPYRCFAHLFCACTAQSITHIHTHSIHTITHMFHREGQTNKLCGIASRNARARATESTVHDENHRVRQISATRISSVPFTWAATNWDQLLQNRYMDALVNVVCLQNQPLGRSTECLRLCKV